MRRALLLAKNGEGRVSPNPMVGAVIVYDGRIIGEGYHAQYGKGHAEVNAINSVKPEERHLLKNSTIYVTLEPCSHYGKTPPCAKLIVDTGIPRVVIGSEDPNPKVSGKGIKILEEAGVEVQKGILEEECKALNRKFMGAQTKGRPFIVLKWAQSNDGYMAALDENHHPCGIKFSTPVSSVWMHRERASVDAILVGGNTERIDSPQLTTRLWGGESPKKYVAHFNKDIPEMLEEMKQNGISSLMVEGGPSILKSFLDGCFYDEVRVEISPINLNKGLLAPALPEGLKLTEFLQCDGNLISVYRR